MKNTKKIINVKKIQLRLFEEIQKKIGTKRSLATEVVDCLGMDIHAAYRRIKGQTMLKIEEICLLCIKHHISFDWLIGIANAHLYEFRPLDLNDSNEVYNRANILLADMEKIKNSAGLNFTVSAMNVPIFYLAEYKELLFFKLFTWYHGVYNYKNSLNSFINEASTQETTACFQKIASCYEHIPSAEIWTDDTINSILRAIAYHWNIHSFPDRELPLQLCRLLLNMLEQLEKWSKTGTKNNSRIPFQFYLCGMNLENDIIMIKNTEIENCTVKLLTINSLRVTDSKFCDETVLWLNRIMQCSVLLSRNAEKERTTFFDAQQQKVEALMKKIKEHDTE